MKIETGKTKIRGFKFKHLTKGVVWDEQMENYIEKEGVIISIHHGSFYQSIRVKFDDGNSYVYPLEMAKQYIINKETTNENDAVDSILYSIGVPYNKLFIDYNPKECIILQEINRRETKQQKIIRELSEGINEILTKIQNRNNMKNLKITAPEGYEIDKANSTFENIVFKPIKKELPKSWEELNLVSGYFVSADADIRHRVTKVVNEYTRNIFATKEQAEASLVLAQLSQLREVYRDGWKPDWTIGNQYKYCIVFCDGGIDKATYYETHAFLSFQSAEVRDLFLENFRDLIEQAKPLMS